MSDQVVVSQRGMVLSHHTLTHFETHSRQPFWQGHHLQQSLLQTKLTVIHFPCVKPPHFWQDISWRY